MTVTPSELFQLALKRHQEPWNWTLHFIGVVGFAITLFAHSYLMFAASLIIFGAGFFDLKMPKPVKNSWFALVAGAVEWEKDWLSTPWNWYKIWRFGFVMTVLAITIWALVTRDGAVLCAIVGFAYLIKIMRENIDAGIEP
ncbi:hypothetical protein [Pseudodesulfovibrio sp. zrk46]|uniref:hypothetical protein n=1 Tax=Pseudodesulfovibrio sp. zrk46 TaxID=2725288 RepID=UPI001FFD8802|nr:hypothetical protein [Pseudodesulfovibrio sp. zrk46]